MAKSKGGGSRSRLRGKLANDVYSIGKDGKGNKQQVVRSLAETVKNPQTQAQMRQRMILTTVSMLSKGLHDFIDHSFDGVPVGQPSVSEFVRRAIKTYNNDAALASPRLGYLNYGSKNFATSEVQVSDGKVIFNPAWTDGNRNSYTSAYSRGGFAIADRKFVSTLDEGGTYYIETYTIGDLVKNIFGGSVDNYITYIAIGKEGLQGDGAPVVKFIRIKVKDGLDMSRVIEGGTLVTSLFDIESNIVDVKIQFDAGISLRLGDFPLLTAYAGNDQKEWASNGATLIFSKKVQGKYQHSKSFMLSKFYHDAVNAADYPVMASWEDYEIVDADFATALATYPIGDEKFLNGGEL